MIDKVEISKDIIRGHIDVIILSLIRDKDMYGYEVYKEVITRTASLYELKEPSLYSAFRRLEAAGYIRSYWGEESLGARRKYYSITEVGREYFICSRSEWKKIKSVLDMLIGDE